MKERSKRNIGIGVFFLAVSLLYLVGASSIQMFSPFGNAGLDSRSIPQMIGILGCALSVLQIVLSWHGMKRCAPEGIRPSERDHDLRAGSGKDKGGNGHKFTLFFSLILLGAYIAVFQDLGFILSSLLYLVLSITLLTPKGKRIKSFPFIMVFSVVVSLSLYYVFTQYLTLLLPRGILG